MHDKKLSANIGWRQAPRLVGARRRLLQGLACAVAAPGLAAVAPPRTRLRLGNTPFLGSAAVYAAIEYGWFQAEGVDIELVESAQGWQSLKGVQEGTLDLGLTAALPIAYSIVNPRHYSAKAQEAAVIVADMITSQVAASGAIGRRDLGVRGPADLRGKRVAVPVGTTLDLYLDLLRSAYGLSEADMTVIDLPEDRHLDALMKGEVAAIFSFRHTIVRAQQVLGDRAVPLASAINFSTNWVLVARKSLLDSAPADLRSVLRALDRGSAFVSEQPALGREILSRRSGIPRETVDRIWGEMLYRIHLPEALARNLETQMRWILRRNGRGGQLVPDLLPHLAAAPMQALWPDRVDILR